MQAVFELDIKELNSDFVETLKKQFQNAKLKLIVKEDETDYLLKDRANKNFLLNSIKEIENGEVVKL